MSVYFSVSDHGHPPKFPTCDYIHFSNSWNFEKVAKTDKKRIKMYEDMGYFGQEINCGIHYFDDTGFLKCKVCGWTP
jgi:hypothetical protein